MTLQEAIAHLMAHTDRKEVIDLIHSSAQPLWQEIFNKGHGVATEKGRLDLEKVTGEKVALEGKLSTANATITELQSKAPDVAKIQQEWSQKLADQDAAHQKVLKDIRDKGITATRDSTLGNIRSKLIAAGVDQKYAAVMTQDPELMKRIVVREDGTVSILQKGATAIELVPAANQTALDILHTELFEAAKKDAPQLVKVSADGGAGVTTGGEGGAKGGAAFYEGIRKQKAEEQKVTVEGGEAALQKRLGMDSATP